MYSIAALTDLADDPNFRADVHTLAGRLLTSPAVRNRTRIAPLLRYGPQTPAVALRVLRLDTCVDLARLDDDTMTLWVRLASRVESTRD
jgi:hypothetical protein